MSEQLLVVGHVHSRTKIKNVKYLKSDQLGRLIGFKVCEIPGKYEKEFGKPYLNFKGYSFFPELN